MKCAQFRTFRGVRAMSGVSPQRSRSRPGVIAVTSSCYVNDKGNRRAKVVSGLGAWFSCWSRESVAFATTYILAWSEGQMEDRRHGRAWAVRAGPPAGLSTPKRPARAMVNLGSHVGLHPPRRTRRRLRLLPDLYGRPLARSHERPGCVVLLSPAAPSYHVYRNFEERGEHFAALARTI